MYVIGHRGTTSFRLKNLEAVLKWLNENNITPIVVEQDKDKSIDTVFQKYKYHYIFAYNAGLYNRSWAFNIAYKMFNMDYMICADNDMILKNEAVTYMYGMCNEYDAINPFSNLYDIDEKNSDIYINTHKINVTSNPRGAMNFSSGICMLSKLFLDTINGWDERFRGWGGEDDAITYSLNALNIKKIELTDCCYHLYHPRSKNDGTHYHENYDNNLKILNEYHNNFTSVLEYKKTQTIGDINKYAND